MKFLQISDTHFRIFDKDLDTYGFVEKTIDYLIQVAEEKQVDKIIHLGDVFHVKDIVTEKSLSKISDIFAKLSDYNVEILVGNHDKTSKDNSTSLLKVFKNFPNIEIIEEYTVDGKVHYMPYLEEKRILSLASVWDIEQTDKILFGHFGMNSFSYQIDGYTDPQLSIKPKLFSQFKRVFLGHFHDHQVKDNIMYVGSPYPTRFGESESKGFVYYDSETDEHEFIENPFAPKYVDITLNKENYGTIKTLTDSFVKLRLEKQLDNETLSKFVSGLREKNYRVMVEKSYTNRKNNEVSVIKEWETTAKADADVMIDEFLEYKDKNGQLPDSVENLKAILRN